jgi:spore maturation protein CgeB
VKVLIVHPGPNFSVADVYNGLVKGLHANGVEVATVNLDDRLAFYNEIEWTVGGVRKKALDYNGAARVASNTVEADLYRYWPDIVIFVSCFFIHPVTWAVLTRRPHKTVAWFTEAPYEDDRQLNVAEYVDACIVNDPVTIQRYRAVNPNTWYLPHSYDPDIHCPGPASPEFACDFGWVGTAFPSRIDFFKQVDWSGVDVKLAGNWQQLHPRAKLRRHLIDPSNRAFCLDNTDTVRLYRSAKMSANLYRKETSEGGSDIGWAVGPREVELAATGTFMLREPRAEGDDLFPDAPTFTEPGEFGDLVRWWSSHDDSREKIVRLNREAAADRTFTNTVARLLGLIEGVRKRVY